MSSEDVTLSVNDAERFKRHAERLVKLRKKLADLRANPSTFIVKFGPPKTSHGVSQFKQSVSVNGGEDSDRLFELLVGILSAQIQDIEHWFTERGVRVPKETP